MLRGHGVKVRLKPLGWQGLSQRVRQGADMGRGDLPAINSVPIRHGIRGSPVAAPALLCPGAAESDGEGFWTQPQPCGFI